ncbi:MAG: hypothetical protein D6730_19555 [Bacteroidetes bacterium]|nr:MAG: hypothetical protein D6730_19555 [Bacteroidota bacterium]
MQHAGPATFAHQDVKTLYARLKSIKQEEKPLVFVADPPMRLGEWVGAASLAAEELAKLDSLQFSRQWCLLLYTRKPDSGLVRSLGRAGRHVQKDSLQQGVLLHLCFP